MKSDQLCGGVYVVAMLESLAKAEDIKRLVILVYPLTEDNAAALAFVLRDAAHQWLAAQNITNGTPYSIIPNERVH